MNYRPWGLLPWVLGRLPAARWSFLGCMNTEERCMSAWQYLLQSATIDKAYFCLVKDPASRFQVDTEARVAQRRAEFQQPGGNASDVHEHSLFARTGQIMKIAEDLVAAGIQNLVIDITSFPKRFFFPLVKRILKSPQVRSLIATYTMPVRYSHEALAEDFQEWRALPLFSGSENGAKPEMLIVNVGYLAMGLPDQIEHGSPRMEVKLLFPFPNAPASYQKTWRFVHKIEQNVRGAQTEMKHVHGMDVSDAFDHIVALTDHGRRPALFAPYGPKPISLAMCIYAHLTDNPVFYTQPRTYNPEYSKGVMQIGGVPAIQAYCLRLDGRDLYTLPTSSTSQP
jgi:hypothetical protein